jgi:hypothetical protein
MANNPSLNIPTARSSSSDWILWHKSLKKMFGKKEANILWSFGWSKRGGINSPANDRTLSNYMEGEGVDIERSTLAEIGEGVLDIGSGILSVGKWFIIIPLGIAGVLMIFILIQLFRNPNKTVGTAIMLTPQGRAVSGASAIKGGGAKPKLK